MASASGWLLDYLERHASRIWVSVDLGPDHGGNMLMSLTDLGAINPDALHRERWELLVLYLRRGLVPQPDPMRGSQSQMVSPPEGAVRPKSWEWPEHIRTRSPYVQGRRRDPDARVKSHRAGAPKLARTARTAPKPRQSEEPGPRPRLLRRGTKKENESR